MKEAIKEEIGFFKLIFAIFVTMIVSLIVWIIKNKAIESKIILILAFITVIGLIIIVSYVTMKIFINIKTLKENGI